MLTAASSASGVATSDTGGTDGLSVRRGEQREQGEDRERVDRGEAEEVHADSTGVDEGWHSANLRDL